MKNIYDLTLNELENYLLNINEKNIELLKSMIFCMSKKWQVLMI